MVYFGVVFIEGSAAAFVEVPDHDVDHIGQNT
jgi:hypothetical protein